MAALRICLLVIALACPQVESKGFLTIHGAAKEQSMDATTRKGVAMLDEAFALLNKASEESDDAPLKALNATKKIDASAEKTPTATHVNSSASAPAIDYDDLVEPLAQPADFNEPAETEYLPDAEGTDEASFAAVDDVVEADAASSLAQTSDVGDLEEEEADDDEKDSQDDGEGDDDIGDMDGSEFEDINAPMDSEGFLQTDDDVDSDAEVESEEEAGDEEGDSSEAEDGEAVDNEDGDEEADDTTTEADDTEAEGTESEDESADEGTDDETAETEGTDAEADGRDSEDKEEGSAAEVSADKTEIAKPVKADEKKVATPAKSKA